MKETLSTVPRWTEKCLQHSPMKSSSRHAAVEPHTSEFPVPINGSRIEVYSAINFDFDFFDAEAHAMAYL